MIERQTDAAVLSAAVRGIRRLKGYTSAEAARGMNLSLRTYQDFEAGKARLNMDYVYRFCRCVDADPEALLIAIAIGSPEFAIRCANNKLMRLIVIGLKRLNDLLGDRLATLDVRSIVKVVQAAGQSLAERAGRDDASAWLKAGEDDLRRSRPRPGR